MNRVKTMARRLLRWAAGPVAGEPVFFAAMWLMCCSIAMGYLAGCFYIDDNRPWHGVRCLLLGSAVAWWLTAAVHSLRRRPRLQRVVKIAVYAMVITLQAVYTFIHLNFDMGIGPRLLILLAETNGGESREFVSTYALTGASLWSYGITVAIIAAVAVAERFLPRLRRFALRRACKAVVCCTFVPLALAGTALTGNYVTLARCGHSKELNAWVRDFGVDALDHLSAIYYSLNYLRVADADMALAVAAAQQVQASATALTEGEPLTVVLVLGESYIKSHASLYGYPLSTTPFLCRERDSGNLVVFTDMVTPYNATSQVQKNVFSLNDMATGEMWYEKPMLPTVMRRAGYTVYFWDNQRNYSTREMFTITVNSFVYNDSIAPLSYDYTSDVKPGIDGNLISNFVSRHPTLPQDYNFVIFHLMGQHVHPVGRYPAKSGFNHFTADSIRRAESWLTKEAKTYVAQYDNATLYNDAVVKRILDLWRDRNTVVLYLADHGDEAYDYRNHCGRGNSPTVDAQLAHCQYDVPVMVWMSDRYIALHPGLARQVRAAAGRPGMTPDLGNMLLRLAGVTTPYYLPRRDITSPAYQPAPRIINDRYDYDRVTAGK